MEEKKEQNQATKKLSYEDLENAARQIAAQLDAVAKENRQLKSTIQQLQLGNLYTELGFRFKVLEHPEFFDENFITQCVNNIVEVMTPQPESDNKEEPKEEK